MRFRLSDYENFKDEYRYDGNVELKRIRFKLAKTCPKFVKEYEGTDVPYDEQMRILGFKSAEYHEETWMHSLSKEEFTWFVLRYS